MRHSINMLVGKKDDDKVAPLLRRIYENAKKNSDLKSNRHDDVVKKFALSLLILTGKSGYELLEKNLGDALPAYSTLQRMMAIKERMVEGKFYFEELLKHLREWKAPLFVHVQLDDTRIKNRVEYDPSTDRFVGFVLPLQDGLPITDSFVLNTFDEISNAFSCSTVAKYAHCIVAKSIKVEVPSFTLAVIGTDSKYDHLLIKNRWNYIEKELNKLNIKVISYGSDGAGPFLKAMISEVSLFHVSTDTNVPPTWTFFSIPELKGTGLCAQDTVHVLAKLRTRLLGPSNLIVLGNKNATRSHLQYVYKNISKEKHMITQKVIDNKDKQNYGSIAILVSEDVENCLKACSDKIRPLGTIVYLTLMRKTI